MIVYRINSCRYVKDLSGKGAALYGGRWNNKNTYIVYTAQSRALALLEAVVHIGKVPAEGYCMAAIEIPDDNIETYSLSRLPEGWNNNPAPDYLKDIGDRFVQAGKHLVLRIPSAIMMEEHNYLINPAHPEMNKIKIISERAINIDDRLMA